MRNPEPAENTVAVGAPAGPAADGTATTSGTIAPWPSTMSETPAPFSENQNGPVGLKEMPQGFTMSGSRTRARPGTSEVRLTQV
jgi:hypothetical protein